MAAGCLMLLASVVWAVPSEEASSVPQGRSEPHSDGATAGEYSPPVQPASDEAERQLGSFKIPAGMKASVIAAEPNVANPVAFWIDNAGRYWVCETFRQGNAVVDNRGRDYWLLDDLAAQTVDDRLAYYTKHLGEKGLAEFSREQDRIRTLEDTTGDGKVDKATVFASGFNEPVDGTGAGVMTIGDDVYYTCIPHVWRLEDSDGDGKCDVYEKLLSGFGVRTAFRGHDMHGLTLGPDGRIYFSIGDRGFHVVTKEGKTLAMPDTGAVLRCEPDGANLEIYAYGLRNPQELAFDDYGNLFTGDNNSDSGDKARWVYVAEGSDSGWRMYYQYLDDRGPWNREMMWYPADSPPLENEGPGGVPKGTVAKDVQPAYILPPVANLGDGPSGLTYYPGVGLPERYKNHFFMADFRGTPANSGIRSFAVEPAGAGFKLVDSQEFIWGILATDCDFTPNGRFVVSDWVNGWNGEGKGRLYGFAFDEHLSQESAKLLAADFSQQTPEELIGLFKHRDRRVRYKAHLELATRPFDSWPSERIADIAKSKAELPALHLAWAAQIQLRLGNVETIKVLVSLTKHSASMVHAAAVRGLADACSTDASAAVFHNYLDSLSLHDKMTIIASIVGPIHTDDPSLKADALQAIGNVFSRKRLADDDRSSSFAELIIEKTLNFKSDPVLFHASGDVLSKLLSPTELARLTNEPAILTRKLAVVALRRLESEKVAAFLADTDPSVVTEAARAINDVPIDAATPQLAAVQAAGLTDPALRRMMNANFRLGGQENAERVAKVAASEKTASPLRLEAIAELKLWADPPPLDRVTGMFRPVVKENEKRETAFMADVLRPVLGGLLAGPEEVRTAAIELAGAYGIQEVAPVLRTILADTARTPAERVAALKGLAAIKAPDAKTVIAAAVTDESASVRAAARTALAALDPAAAVPLLESAVETGDTVEQQAAIAALASLGTPEADAVLGRLADRLLEGRLPPELHLDVAEAAAARPPLQEKATAYEAILASGGPLSGWNDSLVGGNAERGRDIFLNRTAVSCQRCHKAEGRGGEVGPELSDIGSKKDRVYLLESIVNPNAKIAENFESVVIVTLAGKVLTGVKRAETAEALTLVTAEGVRIVVPTDDIDDRAVGKSAMPEDILKHLSRRDVRDLVEFLATRKQAAPSIE